ncbi:MAG: hypothetical protein HY866_18880 [Chloroflexi bacterium]|nr:hypothetical protein [Chloroflexota bacterium]
MRRRWIASLSLGYILMFFSEFLFVNVYPHFDWTGVIPMWIAYSIEAWVFLALLAYFRVRNGWALFLVGAVYGWLLEGVVVQTMYAAFPFQVAFTGLSWHALIDVWVGWYVVRKTMFGGSPRSMARLAVLIGAFWGCWAIWSWQEHEMMGANRFALLAWGTNLLLIPAYHTLNRLEPLDFRPHRWEVRLIAGLHVLIFGIVVLMIPFAALILPPLLVVIYGALRRHRRSPTPATIPITYAGRVGRMQYALLALIPLVALAEYSLALALDARIATNQIIALITVPISVVFFARALIKLYREPVPQPPLEAAVLVQ